MESTIKKLHQLQLMASNQKDVTFTVNTYNIRSSESYWTVSVHFWFCGNIKASLYVNSYDDNANHRIDMMLKYKVLEK